MVHELKIGDVTVPNNIILAPMAGVTDLPFRLLCKEQGAGMTCMEMVSAKAILYKNRNTDALMEIHPEETCASLQLFGNDPEIISEMARKIEERPFKVLDINMGCPVPKVVNNGEGSALMKDPLLAGRIIEATARAIHKPVTVKIRKGFDEDHVNAVELAHIAEESGAAAVAVHARTREQYYAGKADWNAIRAVKEAVHIPVIGNGDVTDGPSAKAMLTETGCDGVMVGRAAQGNPWIFSRIITYLETGTDPGKPDIDTLLAMIERHLKMQLAVKGDYIGIREMRKHVAWYTTGYAHSARIRREINAAESVDEIRRVLDTLRANTL